MRYTVLELKLSMKVVIVFVETSGSPATSQPSALNRAKKMSGTLLGWRSRADLKFLMQSQYRVH